MNTRGGPASHPNKMNYFKAEPVLVFCGVVLSCSISFAFMLIGFSLLMDTGNESVLRECITLAPSPGDPPFMTRMRCKDRWK
jgi:hypothetical protein